MTKLSQNTLLYVLVTVFVGPPILVQAEEPYEKFLQKLKDEQLFDVALDYLTQLESQRGVDRDFKTNLELERGLLLYQSAAVLPPTNPIRLTKLDEAEKSLRNFVEQQKNHPRRGDARLKIGELLLQRADEAKRGAEPGKENKTAVGFYDEAHQLFEQTIKELASILQGIKGARIDPKDTKMVAYRTKIQQDYRQAQLLSAKALEERGRSRAAKSKEWKADLEQAAKLFSDLYSKEQKNLGVRNYALFYRSSIQSELGMFDAAIDGFQRVSDLEGVDVLRPLQTKAVTELVVLLETEQKKFPAAVARGEQWIAGLRPDEQKVPETIELKLQLAKTNIAWAEQLKAEDPQDRVASRKIRDTRTDLRSLLRVPGPHLDETRELLQKLGQDSAEPEENEELPTVKSFSEALVEAQKRLQKMDDDTLPAETLDIATDQALILLKEAIRLYTPADDREQLDQAHYSLAYALVKAQDLQEAIVVADFLARRNPKTQKGLDASGLALRSYGYLLQTADEQQKKDLTIALEPFATYLVETWPDSTEASAAASALVQLALINRDFDKVDRFLEMMPASGGSTKSLRRDAGLSFYDRYVAVQREAGDEATLASLRSRAIESLAIGTDGLTMQEVDPPVLKALNAYARMLLADDKLDQAVKVFFDGPVAPLKALKQNSALGEGKVGMSCYRTAIQLTVGQMVAGTTGPQEAVDRTKSYIEELQAIAGDSEAGKRNLAEIFVELASGLKEQMVSITEGGKRQKMSEALALIAREAAKADSFNTQYWAADTVISLADEIVDGQGGQQLAQKMYGEAAQILEGILQREASSPGWIQPEAFKTQISLRSAMCRRGIGDFKTALNLLGDILKANSGLLEVQEEAARTYQLWGDAQYPQLHKAAYGGGRQNLFWGWGKIAQVLEGKQQYRDKFYNARYNLALSRYKHALSLEGEEKTKELQRAERDVTATATIYPDLGGDELKLKFNSLLKTIQKALQKPANGLSALK